MKKNRLAFLLLFVSTAIAILSCTKINEATQLGGDLIPAVDNVTTFDTSLSVQTFNDTLSGVLDSVRSTSSKTQFLGNINNDPVFGKSEGQMFFQLKPNIYPYNYPFKKDSLVTGTLDSVVLVLGYSATFGDSTLPQNIDVKEITSVFKNDSAHLVRVNDFTLGSSLLSSIKTFIPQDLKDSVKPRGELAVNQLRIRLSSSFANRLLSFDSSNAFQSDSAFNLNFKGFAVVPQNNGIANALVGFNLLDTNTKLAIYYTAKKGASIDTAVTYLKLTSNSANANYIKRDYTGSEFQPHIGEKAPGDVVYIQNTPGSFAKIIVPGLANLNNRVVHRAELIVEQVYDPLAPIFYPPPYLYLDAYDGAINRVIPYDVSLSPSGALYNALPVYQIANPTAFGMTPTRTIDNFGNTIYIWRFNISRYIQHVANKTEPAYDFRLSSQYWVSNGAIGTHASSINAIIPVSPNYGSGRVKVGGGNHPTQKMRLRIVYSRI